MIIFGFRGFVKTLAMLTLVCDHCHNPAAHRLVQRSRWFTLFFIPVFPVSFSRFTVCAYCGATRKIGKQEAEQLLATPEHGPFAPPAAAPVREVPPSAQG